MRIVAHICDGTLHAGGKPLCDECRPLVLHSDHEMAIRAAVAAKDGAYTERNQCVALIARMALSSGIKAGIAKTAIEGWSEDWHSCVYIDFPTGQVSWHYHDSHAWMFAGLPVYEGKWDGHDTPEKYRRVNEAARGAAHD